MNTNANRRSFPEREPLRSEYAEFLFGEGTNYFAQDYLGAHRIGEGVFVFRVWAPRADNVFLTGDFNSWGDDCPMSRSENTGIWVCTLECPSFTVGSRYKFIIERGRKRVFKADPYAFCSETLVNTASLMPARNSPGRTAAISPRSKRMRRCSCATKYPTDQ